MIIPFIVFKVNIQTVVENQLLLKEGEQQRGETEPNLGLNDVPALLIAGYDPEQVLCMAARQRSERE